MQSAISFYLMYFTVDLIRFSLASKDPDFSSFQFVGIHGKPKF